MLHNVNLNKKRKKNIVKRRVVCEKSEISFIK